VVAVVAVTESEVVVLPAEPVDELARLAARCAALAAENEQLWGETVRLTAENERLRGWVGKLEVQLEESRRAGKRQAAPFSRGEPKQRSGRSGRRSGYDPGRHGHREPPGEVDEQLDALLSRFCECGGEIEHQGTEFQYQDELPEPRRVRRRFAVHIGKCRGCGRRHQGRHPFQTSDALGAAGCMLGPRAVALATELNNELGLSPQKTAKALERFGIRITAGGVVGAIARQARVLEPTYQALIEGSAQARRSRRMRPGGGSMDRRRGCAPAVHPSGKRHRRRPALLLGRGETGAVATSDVAVAIGGGSKVATGRSQVSTPVEIDPPSAGCGFSRGEPFRGDVASAKVFA
jgi:hypothetical protein